MQIKIHKEGKIYFIISMIFTFLSFFFSSIAGMILLILSAYIFYFFRDPKRFIPIEDVVLSPADGVVTYIGVQKSPEITNNDKELIKISIFLNIFNVHVNRVPTDGVVKKIKYIHGKFINATLDKSSEDNERNIVCIEKSNKDIIYVTQIAGLIARRIICDIRKDQLVQKGHRFGIIKFGSRVDLYLPIHYKILISKGQTVFAGETIISNPNNILQITNSIKN
jgi:phosphatidylserine decarboxylase|tara:strand:- start:313 stop:981 length:669 start_codon:yes stop_codon:yes gene_type:complete